MTLTSGTLNGAVKQVSALGQKTDVRKDSNASFPYALYTKLETSIHQSLKNCGAVRTDALYAQFSRPQYFAL